MRLDATPVIDGRIEEAAWSEAALVTNLHQIQPTEYAEPSEPTRIFLFYNDEALYIAARMLHEDPETMTANVLRQGETYWGDDLFAVILDPFNDKRSGYRFQVNANGIRMQALFQDTTRHLWDWDGIWDAAATQDEGGWTAEMEIPFKTLSFDPTNDTWGINFRRDIGSIDERMGWVSYNRSQDPSSSGIVVGFEDLEVGRGLDVIPAVALVDSKDYDSGSSDFSTEPSLDVFYKLSPSLNASLTINTDFSATEVDDRQVNLTRFGLFFPEKRDFFLRDSDIFRFGRLGRIPGGGGSRPATFPRATIENGQPFFSRSIGLSSTGEQVDIEYGGKLSGRAGRWNIGALAIRQDEFQDVEASDLFVGRVAANVLEESSLGMIVTQGDPRSNLDNSVLGFDFRYFNTRLANGQTLEGEAWYQQSDTEGIDEDEAAWGLRLRSPNRAGLNWGIGAKELQNNFNPAMGFVNRRGVRDNTAELGYTFRLRNPYIRSIRTGIDAQRFDVVDSGDLQSQVLTFRLLEIDNNRRDRVRIRHYATKESLQEPFEITPGIVIPGGDYKFEETALHVRAGPQRTFFGQMTYRQGDFFDGKRERISGQIGWRPSEHFRTTIDYEVNDIELPAGDFIARLIQWRADVIFSSTLSWVTLIQYDNISETAGINSRLHWIPEAGREAYLVLNHNLQDFDHDDDFHSASADLTIKYNYTFRF